MVESWNDVTVDLSLMLWAYITWPYLMRITLDKRWSLHDQSIGENVPDPEHLAVTVDYLAPDPRATTVSIMDWLRFWHFRLHIPLARYSRNMSSLHASVLALNLADWCQGASQAFCRDRPQCIDNSSPWSQVISKPSGQRDWWKKVVSPTHETF